MQTASEFDVQGARQELLEFYQYLPSLNGWNLNGSAFGHDNASRPLPVLKSHLY
jgi:hypothetical protein